MAVFNPDELVALVRKELYLYRGLLEEQKSQLHPLLEKNASRAGRRSIRQRIAVGRIKKLEQRLSALLEGEPLSRVARRLGHPHGTVLFSLIEQFRMVIREISLVNLRNERFIRTGFWTAESVLSRIFADQTGYDSAGNAVSPDSAAMNRALTF